MKTKSRGSTIFAYSSTFTYLEALFGEKQSKRKTPLSLSVFAKRLGFRSPRSIAMVLKGQRPPSDRFLAAIADYAELPAKEQRYLELLAKKERLVHRGLTPARSLNRELESLSLSQDRHGLFTLQLFDLMSNWYYLVIKQLITAPQFDGTLQWIQRKLAGKVKPRQIEEAIQQMIRLQWVKSDPDTGKIGSAIFKGLMTPQDVPSRAIRGFHREMLNQASLAIERQGVDEREFQALTLKMSPKRIGEFKKCIREFVERCERDFNSDQEEHVYQLNVQLFRHTL